MGSDGQSEARRLRSRLNHPIIDADGHWLEFTPVMREEFRRIGGEPAVQGLAMANQRVRESLGMSLAERRRRRIGQEAFWSAPSEKTLDRATAMLPRLMYERLDDLGIDLAVVYPTAGLRFHRLQDGELRRATCRAYNVFAAEQFREFSDRIIPAAIVPMYEVDSHATGGLDDLDDYFRCRIARAEDIHELFVPRFYFGCEADDPINAWAFNRRANPMGARLNALFSSDIGHFDVPDMADVVPEAVELVEHGLITGDDFRDFMFANAVRVWSEVNPDFFKGTVVEKPAAAVLAPAAARA